MIENWSIRAATQDDTPEMCNLHIAAIKAIDHSIYSSESLESWAFGLVPERYVSAMGEGEEYEVATLANGTVVAFCGVRNGEVYGLYVHPEFQGCGIGRALYARGESRAIRQKPDATVLPLSASLCAVDFYQSLGYHEIEQHLVKSRGGLMMLVSKMKKVI
jgi:ribosomal protein S18 acetylase RimI-like enzyme